MMAISAMSSRPQCSTSALTGDARARAHGFATAASPRIAPGALPELLGAAPGSFVPDAEAHAAPRFDASEHRLARIETSEGLGRAVAGEEISREVASICPEEQCGRVRHVRNAVREFAFEGLPRWVTSRNVSWCSATR